MNTAVENTTALSKAPTTGAEEEQESGEGEAKPGAQPKASTATRETRALWDTQAQLFLACLGLSMGLVNFWRLPTLLCDNGGPPGYRVCLVRQRLVLPCLYPVAFLVPYMLLSFTVAKPMQFMELFLGQFSSQGSVGIWRCVPLGKGIGLCMCIVSVLMSIYLVCFSAHAMLFAWHSLTTELPWAACTERWGGGADCYVPRPGALPCKDVTRWLAEHYGSANLTKGREVTYEGRVFYVPARVFDNVTDNCQYGTHTAAELFYFRHILALSDDVTSIGNFRVGVLVCIGVCWILLYPLASKGVQVAGKALYATSAVPYTLLAVLLIQGMNMRNADVGIVHLLWPDWRRLAHPRVWLQAMEMSLLSAGISTGVAINMGSFNRLSDDNYLVVLGVTLGELLFGLASAVAVFSVLGYQSRRLGLRMEELVRPGLGLYFLSYTGAIGDVEYANVASAALFTALTICTLNSNYMLVESVLTPLSDEFPWLRGQRPRVAFIFCLAAFICSMPMATQNGMYVAFLLDSYVLGMVVPVVAFVEVAFVVAFYGVTRLGQDFKFATRTRLNPYIDLCLRVVAPCALGMTLVLAVVGEEPDLYFESYKYPAMSKMVGWCFAAFGLLQIPLFAYAELYGAEFKVADVCNPKHIWGPDNPAIFAKYLDFLEKHHIKSPAQLSPRITVSKISKAESTGAGAGTGDAAVEASPKSLAAKGAQETVPPQGAATVETTAVASQPVKEDVIRRLSTTLGRTPNELRRMEAVLTRRLSTLSIGEERRPSAQLQEAKKSTLPSEAAKDVKKSKNKPSPPSTPPKLEIEFLPSEGSEMSKLGNLDTGFVPISATAKKASDAPLPVPGSMEALPPEFAGLEAQLAPTWSRRPSAARASVAPSGKPSAAISPPTMPAGMPSGGLQQPTSASQMLSASLPFQPPGAFPPANFPGIPVSAPPLDSGVASPRKSALRQTERGASRGHIVIQAPATPTVPQGRDPYRGFLRRQSTIQGPPVVGYSELLRRPSIKLTLLEPIGSPGPGDQEQVQEQVKRAISDFRRKSVAAMRRMSTMPPQAAGPPSPPGFMSAMPPQATGPPSPPGFMSAMPPQAAGLSSPPGFIGAVPVLPGQSFSRPTFQPGLLSPRKSISTGSFAPNLGDPRLVTQGSYPLNVVAPRRSISAGSFDPNLGAAPVSIDGNPTPLGLTVPLGSNISLGPSPNWADPRRSISAGFLPPNLAPARRSISAGGLPLVMLSPRRSISAGGLPPGMLSARRSISAGNLPPNIVVPRRSISAGSFPPGFAAPRRSISGPGFAFGPRRSMSGGPDFEPRQSIGGGYPPYLLAPRRSLSAGPMRGPDDRRRSSSGARDGRGTSPDLDRLTAAKQASAAKDATDDDESGGDDADDDDASSSSTSSMQSGLSGQRKM